MEFFVDNNTSMKTQFLLMMIGSSLITMLFVGGVFIRNMMIGAEEQVAEVRKTLMADVELQLHKQR